MGVNFNGPEWNEQSLDDTIRDTINFLHGLGVCAFILSVFLPVNYPFFRFGT